MADKTLKVAVVEQSPNIVDALLGVLRQIVYHVKHTHVRELSGLEEWLDEGDCDLILLSASARGCRASDAAAAVTARGADVPIIALYSDRITDPAARIVELLEHGARDVVAKGNRRHLKLVLERELADLEDRRNCAHYVRALREREKRWTALLESSRDPVAYIHGGMHVHANRSYLEMFGFDRPGELDGVPIMDLVSPGDQVPFRDCLRRLSGAGNGEANIELKGLRLDGNTLDIKMELSSATFEDEVCWQIVIRDRSEADEIQAQLDYLRTHDPLTELHNRPHFLECLAERRKPDQGDVRPSTLVYIELDNFNTLKETVGMEAADGVVAGAARMMAEVASDEHLLARFGESVFVMLAGEHTAEEAETLGEAFRNGVAAHTIETEGQSIRVTCSVGVTSFGPEPRTVQAVLKEAQGACRDASNKGGNRTRLAARVHAPLEGTFPESDVSKVVAGALDGDRVSLAFQPIVNVAHEASAIYEVLLRVTDERGAIVPPAKIFSPALAETLATRLDRWVIEHTIALIKERLVQGQETKFFVNLSGQAMLDETLLLYITKLMRRAEIPGHHLVIEIGEALTVTQAKSVKAFIAGLRELGSHAALEHFGTGLCSINTLKHLAVDYIKIDASLVHRVCTDYESESAVRAIVSVARSLNRDTIAFGVEDTATLAKICTLGVTYVQGNSIQSASETLDWDFTTTELV